MVFYDRRNSMTIRQGILFGIKQGILQGINAWWTGVIRLLHLDFSTPVTQTFPETAAGLASALGDASALPSYIWTCDEASGNLVDKIASEPLVPSSSPLYAQTAVGVWDGASMSGKSCFEYGSTGTRAVHASGSFFDNPTNSIAFLVVYRSVGTSYALASKKDGNAGWGIRMVGGIMRADIEDTVGASVGVTVGAGQNDGSLLYACIKVDRTTNLMWIITPSGESSVDISSIGSITSTIPLTLGFQTGFSGVVTNVQIVYQAAFKDGAGEAVTKTKLDNWFVHATDPTGLLTTATRNSSISCEVADGYVGHFSPDTVAIGYHSSFTDTNKLGLLINSAQTNRMSTSENISTWGSLSATKTASDDGASPDGFYSSPSFITTGANGYIYQNHSSTTPSVAFTGSVWIKRKGASDVSGKIKLRDEVNATETTQAYTATDTWQRVSVTHTMGGAGALGRFYVYVDTSGESVYVWGAQSELGDGAGAYIRTTGVAVLSAKSIYKAAGDYIYRPKGELAVTCVQTNQPGVTGFFVASAEGTSERKIYTQANGRQSVAIENAAGGNEFAVNMVPPHSYGYVYTGRLLWNSVDGVDGYRAVAYDGESVHNSAIMPWSGAAASGYSAAVHIGMDRAELAQFDGFISSISCYDAPNT